MGAKASPGRALSGSLGLALALSGVVWAQDQGLPPEAGPPGIQGRSANRIQGAADNEAARLAKELQRALKDEVFSIGDATVIPPDREGRAAYHPAKGYRILSVELPYTTDPMSEETRQRLVAQGRGDLYVQHITFKGADGAAQALHYATETLVKEKQSGQSSSGIVVRGNRIVALEDASRLLVHQDERGRAVARERLQSFAATAFQFAGGANEALQAQILVLGQGELVVTLPREYDDDLLERGFAPSLGSRLASAKVVRQGSTVSYVIAPSAARADKIADDLKPASTAAAQQARRASQLPAGAPREGMNQQLDPH